MPKLGHESSKMAEIGAEIFNICLSKLFNEVLFLASSPRKYVHVRRQANILSGSYLDDERPVKQEVTLNLYGFRNHL